MEILPAVGAIATPLWLGIAQPHGRTRRRNVRYQDSQGSQRDVGQIHA